MRTATILINPKYNCHPELAFLSVVIRINLASDLYLYRNDIIM